MWLWRGSSFGLKYGFGGVRCCLQWCLWRGFRSCLQWRLGRGFEFWYASSILWVGEIPKLLVFVRQSGFTFLLHRNFDTTSCLMTSLHISSLVYFPRAKWAFCPRKLEIIQITAVSHRSPHISHVPAGKKGLDE